MIVWGGRSSESQSYFDLGDGGRYDPLADLWTPMNSVGAPTGRQRHQAVWTGEEMFVWGGSDGDYGDYLPGGGRYDPATDSWGSMSPSPDPVGRTAAQAFWTGSEVIVWGGRWQSGLTVVGTGARYDPDSDTWTEMSETGAPVARRNHTSVWTGSELVVWGGNEPSPYDRPYDTGGRYDPATDSWTAVTLEHAPLARTNHTAVWTGSYMIVWGRRGRRRSTAQRGVVRHGSGRRCRRRWLHRM